MTKEIGNLLNHHPSYPLTMAYNDTQVEIKFQLDKQTYDKVKQRLKQSADFQQLSHQTDEYFTPAHRNFLAFENPYEWLRIRKKQDKSVLTYMHWHPANQHPFTHCDEFELDISCPDRMKKIFSSLDMKSLTTVDKQREIFIVDDELEIVLDTVKELGHFMEIEALKDFGSIELARKKLETFASSLGLDPAKTVERGYPYLLMQKKGLLK
jgi:predicted adenylyl cyclase CyaB